LFFKFSRSKHGSLDENLKKFIKVMCITESDIAVLKFWTTGLGKQHRAHLLAT